jgi:hypothetical protein
MRRGEKSDPRLAGFGFGWPPKFGLNHPGKGKLFEDSRAMIRRSRVTSNR